MDSEAEREAMEHRNESKLKNSKKKLKGTGRTGKTSGRPSTAKAGCKRCKDCSKEQPLTCFKPGNSVCTDPCLKMKDNIFNACKTSGVLPWYQEQRADAAKWKKLIAWYKKQCPPKEVNGVLKMGGFKVMQYQTEVKAESQIVKDDNKEMMHVT